MQDLECEIVYNNASKDNPIVIDSVEGKHVMKWLERKNQGRANTAAHMIHSRQPFVSPVDGKVIKSGADLRAHEREHNIIQVGNEYVGLVNEKREEQRQLKSDMGRQVREAEKNGMQDNSSFKYI